MNERPALLLARKWWLLSRDEHVALVQAALAVPAVALSLRVIGFNRVQRWLERASARRGAPQPPAEAVVRISVLSLNRVKQYSLFRGNCLSQSLALAWLLRRRGLTPTLRLGVRRPGPRLDAHAWVEFEGRVLNDTEDVHTRFAPLSARPESR